MRPRAYTNVLVDNIRVHHSNMFHLYVAVIRDISLHCLLLNININIKPLHLIFYFQYVLADNGHIRPKHVAVIISVNVDSHLVVYKDHRMFNCFFFTFRRLGSNPCSPTIVTGSTIFLHSLRRNVNQAGLFE
jgi:hypothetical protein